MAGSHRPPRHISLLATPLLLLLFVLPWIACLQLLLMPTPVSANTGLNQPDLSFLSIANPNPLYVPPYQPFEDPMAPSPRPRIQRRQSQVQQEQFMGGYCYGQQVFTNATGILTATAFYSNYSNDMNCVWIIEAPQANEVIKVTFDYFHTECGYAVQPEKIPFLFYLFFFLFFLLFSSLLPLSPLPPFFSFFLFLS